MVAMNRPKRINNQVPVLSAREAIDLIPDEASVAISGAGGGITEATLLIDALADRYKATKSPKNLTFIHATGLGDRASRGMSPLGLEGLCKKAIGGHWGQSPGVAELAEKNLIQAYNFPQGIIAQLFRTAAAHQPGILTEIGMGTFIDPRQQGGKLNEVTKEDLIKIVKLDGKEWLFYPSLYPDVAFLRGTTADAEGYISMEDEVLFLDNLATAQAVHNNGGIVIMQVQRIVKAGTLHPRQVKIPGYLVDVLVVDPNQNQLYDTPVNRFISGDFTVDPNQPISFPLNQRKLVARRALMEAKKGAVGNVGVGIADGIGIIAREEGVDGEFTLTVETGASGGISSQGVAFGANVNSRALLDMPAQFDFYHGGGLDVCYLSFAEVNEHGDVNVHKFNGKIMGTGGFVDIHQKAKKLVFCGTLMAAGLATDIKDGKLTIVKEGRVKKMVKSLPEITFGGKLAFERGQEVYYITERAVFKLEKDGLCLIEVAPGVDMQKDVIDKMEFTPKIAKNVKLMDARLFLDKPMGIVLPE